MSTTFFVKNEFFIVGILFYSCALYKARYFRKLYGSGRQNEKYTICTLFQRQIVYIFCICTLKGSFSKPYSVQPFPASARQDGVSPLKH